MEKKGDSIEKDARSREVKEFKENSRLQNSRKKRNLRPEEDWFSLSY